MAEHAHDKEVIDTATGQTIRSHEWDGIQELNTPLPRWWINVFYATIIWSVGYMIAYPAWPLISSYTKGVLGYSSRAEVAQELADLKALRAVNAAGLATASVEDITKNPELRRIALAQGRTAFGDNCAPCHGAGGAGSRGYPNLNDDDWLWGGSLAEIHKTLQIGIRVAGRDDTRQSPMAAYGRQGILKPDEIRAVSNHVRGLANLAVEANHDREKGARIFAEHCASCHGEKGQGMQEQGAPNLTDAIWLFGSSLEDVMETVSNGRAGVMPAWDTRLDPVTIKALTVYVHSLSGGK